MFDSVNKDVDYKSCIICNEHTMSSAFNMTHLDVDFLFVCIYSYFVFNWYNYGNSVWFFCQYFTLSSIISYHSEQFVFMYICSAITCYPFMPSFILSVYLLDYWYILLVRLLFATLIVSRSNTGNLFGTLKCALAPTIKGWKHEMYSKKPNAPVALT
jgi:hypothetical protein